MNWRAIWAIARKDIVDALKNLYILFGLVLPIGMSLLFRLLFSELDELGTLTIAVYDPGGSYFVAELREMPEVRVLEVNSPEQLSDRVEQEAIGGLALPLGFDADVAAGKRPSLTVYVNARRGGGERFAFQTLVERKLWTLGGRELPARATFVNVSRLGGTQDPAEFDFERYLLVVALIMALAMTGALVVPTLLVEEKEKHTLDALLVSPASPADVVASKALTGLVYSLLTTGVLIAMNRGWEGNWPVTVVTILLGALFMVMVGLLMGGLFHTTAQVNTWSSVVMLALTMPSWFTILPVPALLQTALRLNPTHYLVEALNLSLAGEASLMQVGDQLAVLAGSAVLVFIAVVWTLRRLEHTGA
jgi:ABC-2 type transport system permease protein